MKTGIELIAEERLRQIEKEGWTFEHDDEHDKGELAIAASCYALPGHKRSAKHIPNAFSQRGFISVPKLWPWHADWWRPTSDDRIRELTKAGALIAAEIDRLQRLNSQNQ